MLCEEVVIARDNKPVVKLVPIGAAGGGRRPGPGKGEVRMAPVFHAPRGLRRISPMDLLLDTHAFVWWVADAPELSEPAREVIADATKKCTLRPASCWAKAIESSLGWPELSQPIEPVIPEHMRDNGFDPPPIEFRPAARVEALPLHHRDPCARLLSAQAQTEKLAIVFRDAVLSANGVRRIWSSL